MEINIRKSEVYKEVEKQSLLVGTSMDEGIENLWASEYEGHFLDSFWIEGVAAVIQLLKRHLKGDTITHDLMNYDKEEVLNISIVLPQRFSESLEGSIINSLKMMLSSNIFYRWLLVKNPELSEKYKVYADDYVNDLKQKLFYRKEPVAKELAPAIEDAPFDEEEETEFFRRNIHDHVKFNQYERCNDYPQSRGNNG